MTSAARTAVETLLRDVPDFPNPGVMFKDITPLLGDPAAFAVVVEALADAGRSVDGSVQVDVVAGLEARGFLFGTPVAQALGVGFVPIRKAGRLPGAVHTVEYSLEYGTASIEVQQDAIGAGARVLLVDDVLATGGTGAAARTLLERCGGSVTGLAVLLELSFLSGRSALTDLPVTALAVT